MKYDTDIVMSGSGVRLLSHVGALYALLKDEIINIKRIAGVSGGAIIAATFSALRKKYGVDFKAIEETKNILLNTDIGDLIKDSYFPLINLIKNGGLYHGDKFEKFINDKITNKTMRELEDLYILTAELVTGQQQIIHAKTFPTLSVAKAVRRSMSVPVYFVPNYRTIEGKLNCYVDGGILNNFPIDIFDDGQRPTIGIRLYSESHKINEKFRKLQELNVKDILSLTINNMISAIEREHIEDAYWADIININTGSIESLDFDIKREDKEWLFMAGYNKAREWLAKTDLSKMQVRGK